MAMSAAAPVYRGLLSDIDCRWKVISASVDDRKPEEFSRIRKSRYDSIDFYLHESSQQFNDIDIAFDKDVFEQLQAAGIDNILAKHIAHLWIRDPISVFKERIEMDDSTSSERFENIQSTNWQTMRFKPPPPNSNIGWRVEFRPTEIQISDFENAAFVCFLVLLTRAILAHNLQTTIPISKVDENMETAHKKDAVLNERFWFRTNFDEDEAKISNLNINEIINGGHSFRGLIPIIESYLADLDIDLATACNLDAYLKFISKRASGEFCTNAKWIREFVRNHPEYKQDSVVSEEINYDLLKKLDDICEGRDIKHKMFNKRECSAGYSVGFAELTPGTRRVYGKSCSETITEQIEPLE